MVLSSARRGEGREGPAAPRCQRLPEIYVDCSSNENSGQGLWGGGKTWEQIVSFSRKIPEGENNFKAIQTDVGQEEKMPKVIFQEF